MNDPIHNFTLRYHCIGGGHGVNRLDWWNGVYADRRRFNRVYRDFLRTVQKEKEVLTRPLSFHAKFTAPIMDGSPKLYLEVFKMKTFLGFVTGSCIGAIGIMAAVIWCMSNDENYAKGILTAAGYDHAILIKKKG